MKPVKKVLFVCTGNICRSATAEHWLRHVAKTRGLALETRSCGTAAQNDYKVPDVVRRLLAEKGVPPFEHKATFVSREPLAWADAVYAMTELHAEALTDRYPEFTKKIFVLREAAGFPDFDVEDPMGFPDEAYVKSLAAIEEALEVLIESDFTPVPPKAPPPPAVDERPLTAARRAPGGAPAFASLEEFWPYYVSQHLNPVNRVLHFTGTTTGLACLAASLIWSNGWGVPAGLILSYGQAWIGHYFFECNQPATFEYPFYSFLADFRMYALMWRCRMGAEILRLNAGARR